MSIFISSVKRPKQRNAGMLKRAAQQNNTIRINVPNKFRQQNNGKKYLFFT